MIRNTPQPLNLAKAVVSVALLVVFFLVSLATAQATTVNLAWDPSPSSSVTGYRVYYGQSSGSYTATTPPLPNLISKTVCVGTPVTCTYTTPDLPAGTYFAVKAFDSTGKESGFSNEVRSPVGNPPVANFDAYPTSGMVPLDVTFMDKSLADTTITKWTWNFGDNSAPSYAINPTHKYTTAGTYTASLIVSDSLGNQSSPKTMTIKTTSSSSGLLLSNDIGSVGLVGSASYTGGAFTVKGSGVDIWGTADAFRFVYQPLNGNGTIVARVASMTNTDAWAKAGVMIRETLGANSRHAMVVVTPRQGVAFQRRLNTGDSSYHTAGAVKAPYWVKLTRSGNYFYAYQSQDGVTWERVGWRTTISMVTSVYVGLVVTSHNNGVLNTATFDNVSIQ